MGEAAAPAVLAAMARQAARRYGTPLYLYDLGRLRDDARTLSHAFPDPWLRLYSLKANATPGLVREIAALGFGANVVSLGEWRLARTAGVDDGRTALSGIGKTERDLAQVVAAARTKRPLLWVSIESEDEARALARHAATATRRPTGIDARTDARIDPRIDARIDALVRLNPAVLPETHPGLAVGTGDAKFGVIPEELPRLLEAGGGADGPIRWRGIHLHIGTQLAAVDAWRSAIRRALAVFALFRGDLVDFDTVDCGSGFPVPLPGETVPSPAQFAAEVRDALDALPADRRPARLAVEPGRVVVARSGSIVARVLHVRERTRREAAVASEAPPQEQAMRQIVLDAGMTELIRPALYGARHPIRALTSLGRPHDPDGDDGAGRGMIAQVEGPICESTDHLGLHTLPPLRRGDLVSIGLAGAYASAMASTYNGRPRAPEIALDGGRLRTLRARGALERLP
jgi:diaminopimelate decarboxylase